jgi:hypothetical protein
VTSQREQEEKIKNKKGKKIGVPLGVLKRDEGREDYRKVLFYYRKAAFRLWLPRQRTSCPYQPLMDTD